MICCIMVFTISHSVLQVTLATGITSPTGVSNWIKMLTQMFETLPISCVYILMWIYTYINEQQSYS